MKTSHILVVVLILGLTLSGCVRVGTRVCTVNQTGCDFVDHVLRIYPSGVICATWNVDMAQYSGTAPSASFAVKPGDDELVETLKFAQENDKPVRVWYAGQKYVLQSTCHADYPHVIYRAELVGKQAS